MTTDSNKQRRTVLLRHDLPDGSWHWDWMIEQGSPLGLMTFRLNRRPQDAVGGEVDGERLADHRVEYLDYEGPISSGRGAVTRVASGTCTVEESIPNVLTGEVRFLPESGVSFRFRGEQRERQVWRFTIR